MRRPYIVTHVALIIIALSTRAAGQEAELARPPDAGLPKSALEMTTLNFKDADVRDIFRALSHQHKLNLFVDNSITARTTVALSRVRVIDAVRFLCEQNNLVLVVEGGIIRIAPAPKPLPPPPKPPMVYYEGGLLSVQLKNDHLEQVVERLIEATGKNILVAGGTTGLLSGTLNDIDFDVGITQLMNNNGFAVQTRNGIYIVSRLEHYVGPSVGGQGPQQRAGPYWISVKDSLVTIDVTNASIERVINDIVRQMNADVVFYNPVTGIVTARASNISLGRALDLILRNTNFAYRESEGILFVGEKSSKALASTKLLRLKYLRAEKAVEMIPPSIASQSTAKVLKEHNGIVMIAQSDVVNQAEEFLQAIDKPVAQVLIEAVVVDFDRSRGLELGAEAGFRRSADTSLVSAGPDILVPGIDVSVSGSQLNRMLSGSLNLFGVDLGIANLGRLPGSFYLNLRALEEKGLANVRSRPLIATLNGHTASLSIGTTQYFILKTTTPYRDPTQVIFQESQQFQTIEADVKLEITPYVGADGQITVEIKPDFRTPVGILSPNIPPTINRRAMSSTLVMREGETIVLGGLIQELETEQRTQTPILGSIPLLGALFSSTSKSTRKSELIIYVTPHISYGEAFQQVELK
jgi:type IV pilus assembly protein PilQ